MLVNHPALHSFVPELLHFELLLCQAGTVSRMARSLAETRQRLFGTLSRLINSTLEQRSCNPFLADPVANGNLASVRIDFGTISEQ
jgi:hypothetical protein